MCRCCDNLDAHGSHYMYIPHTQTHTKHTHTQTNPQTHTQQNHPPTHNKTNPPLQKTHTHTSAGARLISSRSNQCPCVTACTNCPSTNSKAIPPDAAATVCSVEESRCWRSCHWDLWVFFCVCVGWVGVWLVCFWCVFVVYMCCMCIHMVHV